MNNIKAVRKTIYRCKVCGKEYGDRKKAMKECGSYELEPPQFRIGEEVLVWYANQQRRAKVIRRVGPVIGNQCRDGKRRYCTGAHVYMYQLKPIMKDPNVTMRWASFWTSDLMKI